MSEQNDRIDDQEKEIDLLELAKTIWRKRKTVAIWSGIGLLLGIVVAFSIPKEYTTAVKLAPESADGKGNGGNLGALAAMAGVSLGSSGADAVSPQLYPDIVKSIPFSLSLLEVPLQDKNGRKGFTVADYLENDTEKPWWSAVTGLPGKILGAFSSGKKNDSNTAQDEMGNIIRLTDKQQSLVNAVNGAVNVAVDVKTMVISINVTLQDPVASAILADSVASQLKEYVTDYRTNKARKDLEYVENLNREAKEAYYKAQQKYATYLDQNQGIVLYSAQTMRDRLENETTLAFNMFNQTSQQLQLAEAKVQEQTPVFATIDPPAVPTKPSAPRKLLILVGFTFLAAVLSIAWVLFIQPLREESKKQIKLIEGSAVEETDGNEK